jgi:hypothetical protein
MADCNFSNFVYEIDNFWSKPNENTNHDHITRPPVHVVSFINIHLLQ